MKIAGTIFFLIILSVSCKNQKADNSQNTDLSNLKPVKIEITIKGMTCTGCEQAIQGNVSKLEGIKSIIASHEKGNAIVEFYEDKVDTSMIKEAITETGYTVTGID